MSFPFICKTHNKEMGYNHKSRTKCFTQDHTRTVNKALFIFHRHHHFQSLISGGVRQICSSVCYVFPLFVTYYTFLQTLVNPISFKADKLQLRTAAKTFVVI